MNVGIVGSRRRNSMKDRYQVFGLMEFLIREFDKDLVVISGGCPEGADLFAEEACKAYGVPMAVYLPNFSEGHRFPAEPFFKRNLEIAQNSNRVYHWVAEDRTGGTENTLGHCLNLGREIYLVDGQGNCYLSKDGLFPKCAPLIQL